METTENRIIKALIRAHNMIEWAMLKGITKYWIEDAAEVLKKDRLLLKKYLSEKKSS